MGELQLTAMSGEKALRRSRGNSVLYALTRRHKEMQSTYSAPSGTATQTSPARVHWACTHLSGRDTKRPLKWPSGTYCWMNPKRFTSQFRIREPVDIQTSFFMSQHFAHFFLTTCHLLSVTRQTPVADHWLTR